MKFILDNNDVDKPFRIPLQPDIKVFEQETGVCLNSDDTVDLLITEAQKNRLQSLRCRTWWFTSWLPPPIFDKVVRSDSQYSDYAYILHDCDLNADGSPKKNHIHCILFTKTNITASNIAYRFHTVDIQELSNNFNERFLYLTHDSEECQRQHKYLYDASAIVSSNIDYIKSHCTVSDDNKAYNMYNDFVSGFKAGDMLKKYGFSYLQNVRNLILLRSLDSGYNILYSTNKNVVLTNSDGEIAVVPNSEINKL